MIVSCWQTSLALGVVLTWLTAEAVQVSKITCEPSSVRIGEPAEVVCTFDDSLIKLQRSHIVNVERFAKRGDKPDNVILFHISENNETVRTTLIDQTVHYMISPGFTVEYPVDNNLRLKIANASSNNTGYYSCSIKLTENPQQKPSHLPCHFKLVVGQRSHDDSKPAMTMGTSVAVAVIVTLLVTIIVCGAIGFYFWRKQKWNRYNVQS